MSGRLEETITRAWFGKAAWLWLLTPLSVLFFLVSSLRKLLFKLGLKPVYRSQVPVIVVGNITVGGAGKSPLVAYLVREFQALGLRPGVVSRGYGSRHDISAPILVSSQSTVEQVGDEPLMLFRQLDVPVSVCPKRSDAVHQLNQRGCNLIIADDGLQHWAMARDLELCVFDGQRLWGNGLLLPAGPLREPLSRLSHCQHIIVNGGDDKASAQIDGALGSKGPMVHSMRLQPSHLRSVNSKHVLDPADLAGERVVACAGIGNPERFFQTLTGLGVSFDAHTFPDHHDFKAADFASFGDKVIVMTEKDAVKCRNLGLKQAYYLPVQAQFEDNLAQMLVDELKQMGRLLLDKD